MKLHPVLLCVVAALPLAAQDSPLAGYGQLPLSFEANRGQFDAQATFLARGLGYRLFLTRTGLVMSLRTPGGGHTTLQADVVGANPDARCSGVTPSAGRFHYFHGNDPATWHTDIEHFQKVRCRDVLPGIDIVYYGNQRCLEYDFVVSPGADADKIRVRFRGVDRMALDDSTGELVFTTKGGELRQQAPVAYQDIDGRRMVVSARYDLVARDTVGFRFGRHDRTRPLVIDPILVYSTYLGSTGSEQWVRMVADTEGQAILSGWTFSPQFPTVNALDTTLGSQDDVFVTKFTADGSSLVFSTFLGGGSTDSPGDVAVASDGSVAICGRTSSGDFPLKNAIFTPAPAFPKAFATVLSKTGALVFSTYVGSANKFGGENAVGITFDAQGNLIVAGSITTANDFATKGSFQESIVGGVDIFVAKIDPTSSGAQALKAVTYVGGKVTDNAIDVEIGKDGAIVVLGITNSVDFPAPNGFQGKNAGGWDAVVFVLDPSLATMHYGTHVGGSSNDLSARVQVEAGLATDASGCIYVGGNTSSSDFPTTAGAFDTTFEGGEAFVMKIDPSKLGAASLIFSSFIGGEGSDGGQDVAVDEVGNVYVSGFTNSITSFPLKHAMFPKNQDKNTNFAFLTVLDPSGAKLLFSTTIGGLNGGTEGSSVAVGSNGAVYLAGNTGATSGFPTTSKAFQQGSGGGSDA